MGQLQSSACPFNNTLTYATVQLCRSFINHDVGSKNSMPYYLHEITTEMK